jgi:hypothetical protein
METQEQHARAVLAGVAEARRRAADRIETPRWYHPLLGASIGLIFAAPALGPVAMGAADVVGALGMALLARAYRERVGVWSTGKLRGSAARLRYVYIAALFVAYVPCAVVAFGSGPSWVIALTGVWAVVATATFGPRYDERLRRELRAGA